mmetsp:Transcript_5527/g.14068  ORF Transcript_5527/g.14068 Transcript_5527/m.14068 type:complete len:266 (-) Transcript_5527:17-814(-)
MRGPGPGHASRAARSGPGEGTGSGGGSGICVGGTGAGGCHGDLVAALPADHDLDGAGRARLAAPAARAGLQPAGLHRSCDFCRPHTSTGVPCGSRKSQLDDESGQVYVPAAGSQPACKPAVRVRKRAAECAREPKGPAGAIDLQAVPSAHQGHVRGKGRHKGTAEHHAEPNSGAAELPAGALQPSGPRAQSDTGAGGHRRGHAVPDPQRLARRLRAGCGCTHRRGRLRGRLQDPKHQDPSQFRSQGHASAQLHAPRHRAPARRRN